MKRAALLALMLLAACGRSEEEAANTADIDNLSAQGSDPLPTPELSNTSQADGIWTFQASAAGSAAMFGVSGKAPDFSIRCDPATKTITFVRATELPPGGLLMKIVTGQGAASYPAVAGNEDRPVALAKATSSDTFITGALAHATHGIGVVIGDGGVFLMPVDPMVANLINTCPR